MANYHNSRKPPVDLTGNRKTQISTQQFILARAAKPVAEPIIKLKKRIELSFFCWFLPEFHLRLIEIRAFALQILVNRLMLATLNNHLNCMSCNVGLLEAADYPNGVAVDDYIRLGEFFDEFAGFTVGADDSAFDAFDVGFAAAENQAQIHHVKDVVFVAD